MDVSPPAAWSDQHGIHKMSAVSNYDTFGSLHLVIVIKLMHVILMKLLLLSSSTQWHRTILTVLKQMTTDHSPQR